MALVLKFFSQHFRIILQNSFQGHIILVLIHVSALQKLSRVIPKRTSNGNNFSNELKNAQTMKPSMRGSNGLKDVLIKISIIVEQFEDVDYEFKIDFFSIYFLVDASNEYRKYVIEELRSSLFQHLLGNCSNLRLVVV